MPPAKRRKIDHSGPFIDPTTPSKDRLTALPSEILCQVIDYLLPNHDPDRVDHYYNLACRPMWPSPPHSLISFHKTCRRLNAETQAWAEYFLRRHLNVTGYRDLKTAKRQQARNFFQELNRWTRAHCVFCGRKSSRNAIFVSSFRCCSDCDKAQWPGKMTKTNALAVFKLKPRHLLPDRELRLMIKSGDVHDPDVTQVRYGKYVNSNVVTTMFALEDLRTVAAAVHGRRWIQVLRAKYYAGLLKMTEKGEGHISQMESLYQTLQSFAARLEGEWANSDARDQMLAGLGHTAVLFDSYEQDRLRYTQHRERVQRIRERREEDMANFLLATGEPLTDPSPATLAAQATNIED